MRIQAVEERQHAKDCPHQVSARVSEMCARFRAELKKVSSRTHTRHVSRGWPQTQRRASNCLFCSDAPVPPTQRRRLGHHLRPALVGCRSATCAVCGELDRTSTAEQLDAVIAALVEVPCRPGDVIIRQGDAEDTRFFIVSSGEYSVLVHATGSAPVHTYGTVGDSFGELALRYGSPRKATVICDAGGVLWALAREHFQLIECT